MNEARLSREGFDTTLPRNPRLSNFRVINHRGTENTENLAQWSRRKLLIHYLEIKPCDSVFPVVSSTVQAVTL